MSDLVPFVAAALRDRTIQEMAKELQTVKEDLRVEREERYSVEITGPGGSPLYYRSNLLDEPELVKDDKLLYIVQEGVNCLVPFDRIGSLEFRMGGIVVEDFGRVGLGAFIGLSDEMKQHNLYTAKFFSFRTCPLRHVFGTIYIHGDSEPQISGGAVNGFHTLESMKTCFSGLECEFWLLRTCFSTRQIHAMISPSPYGMYPELKGRNDDSGVDDDDDT